MSEGRGREVRQLNQRETMQNRQIPLVYPSQATLKAGKGLKALTLSDSQQSQFRAEPAYILSYFNQLCKFLSSQGDPVCARGKGQKLLLPIFTPGATFGWRGQRIPPEEGVAALEENDRRSQKQVWRKDRHC